VREFCVSQFLTCKHMLQKESHTGKSIACLCISGQTYQKIREDFPTFETLLEQSSESFLLYFLERSLPQSEATKYVDDLKKALGRYDLQLREATENEIYRLENFSNALMQEKTRQDAEKEAAERAEKESKRQQASRAESRRKEKQEQLQNKRKEEQLTKQLSKVFSLSFKTSKGKKLKLDVTDSISLPELKNMVALELNYSEVEFKIKGELIDEHVTLSTLQEQSIRVHEVVAAAVELDTIFDSLSFANIASSEVENPRV